MRGTGGPRQWDREDLDPKTVVLDIGERDEATGYPLPRVETAGGIVADTAGGCDVVVVAAGGLQAVEGPGFPVTGESATGVASFGFRPGGCSPSPGRTSTARRR